MGGPNNLEEVELFLKNMFSDPNILTMKSTLLRKFIGTMIVFSRAEQAQEVYRELGGKSPLVEYTQKLVEKLQQRVGEEVLVDFAMRYTPPFADNVAKRFEEVDVKDIYLIPLYPQYSTTTTKSSLEDFIVQYEKQGGNATLHVIKNFYRNPLYNQIIIERIKEVLDRKKSEEYTLVFSAHGLPQKIVDAGDPYQRQVQNHVKILSEMLQKEDMAFDSIELAYQSKVGPMKWLEPSLEEKLKELKNKKVIIFPIAFTIDNSETDFELHVEYKEIADELGFEEYLVARCPNESDSFVEALLSIYTEMQE